jgi:chemotaxis protein MotB
MLDSDSRIAQWQVKPNATNRFKAPLSLADQAGAAEADAFLWSMVDLMTLLLVFFVLLYAKAINGPVTATLEPEQGHSTVAFASVGHLDDSPQSPTAKSSSPEVATKPDTRPSEVNTEPEPQAPEALTEPDPQPEEAEEAFFESLRPEMMNRLQSSFSDDFYVRWDEKQPVFVLGERITFNVGEAMLLPDSQSALRRIADLVAPQSNYQVIVSGHTDNVAIRTPMFPSNWELSAARAASVAKFLAVNGVAPQRLIIQGKSEFHPLVANTSEENRGVNRRVEISLLNVEQTSQIP